MTASRLKFVSGACGPSCGLPDDLQTENLLVDRLTFALNRWAALP